MTKVIQTNNYSLFKKNQFNRSIDASNLKYFADSMKKKNLLPWNPIIVDKNMVILDGQHRFQAAQTLKLPVSYIVMEEGTDSDLLQINTAMKKWEIDDFLQYWSLKGRDSYQFITQMEKQFDFRPRVILTFLGTNKKTIVEGLLNLNSEERVSLINLLEKVRKVSTALENLLLTSQTNKSWVCGVSSVRALANILKHPAVTVEELIEKFNLCSMHLSRKSNVGQYCAMYLSVWNYQRRNRIQLDEIYTVHQQVSI